jgi:hypothetical protein
MSTNVDDFLTHYGVKGMRWGKRGSRPTESRRDYKKRIKGERQAHEKKKLEGVIKTAMKGGEDVLVKTQLPGDYATTIMTGKQFVDMAGRGALLNAKTTDIFAILDKKQGQFVLNPNPTPEYKPSERR